MRLSDTQSAPSRPLLRWYGGKWNLASWIISHFPAHRVYVEPFGGAASVLLQKPRAYLEVYNDLDADLVNLFSVLRSPPEAARLGELLQLTPFARAEFLAAYDATVDPVERARRMIVRSFMGHGAEGAFGRPTGFRANANASGRHNTAAEWAGYPAALAALVERFSGVVVEQSDALDLLRRADRADALFYVDPPYVHATRGPTSEGARKPRHTYAHELSDADHGALLDCLRGLTGAVALSGYPHPLYDDALAGWRRVETKALADGARERIECLWLNPSCVARLGVGPLFEGVAECD